MNETLLQLAGRLHPMLLHLPIGVLAGVLLLELWGRFTKSPERRVRLLLVWFLVLTAACSVGSGLLLSQEDGYGGTLIDLHKWLAFISAGALLIAAVLATAGQERAYLGALFGAAILMIPTGHFGAGMTHGQGFLTAPLSARDQPTDTGETTPTWYTNEIAPILESHCTMCHGPTRQKGGLAIHTIEAINAGGKSGPVLMTDDDAQGELLRRVRLPMTDDAHMPPEGKPQPSDDQLTMLERWVKAGAPIDTPPPTTESIVDAREPRTAPRIPMEAVAELRRAHVHVEVIDPTAQLLWIDSSATPELETGEIVRLLTPLAPMTAELSLRGMMNANDVLVRCGPWTRLQRLDLSSTSVHGDGLAAASRSSQLVELTLIKASISADAVDELLRLDTLEHIHIWGSDIPESARAQLRQSGSLVVNAGVSDTETLLEVEPRFDFGKPAGVATSLEPVNELCPVTARPVDTRFAIVHDGRVIGFCCNKCPNRFWEDPASFDVATGDDSPETATADEAD